MLATILGTAQATLTKFPYLRKVWKTNTEEERLLGVSLTGIMDNELTSGKKNGLDKTLTALREIAVETNKEWSAIFGIPKAQQSPVSNQVGQYHSLWTQAVVSTLVIAVIIFVPLGAIIKILSLTSW